MGFSNQFLENKYQTAFNNAINAQKKGNMLSFKENLLEALRYLKMLEENTNIIEKKNQYEIYIRKLQEILVNLPKDLHNNQNHTTNINENRKNNYTRNDNNLPDDVSQYLTIYKPEDIKISFKDIIGLEEVKQTVTDYIINPIRYPDYYKYEFLDNKTLLLEGKPGTGKTTFAKAVAKELNQPFVVFKMSGLINSYIGETAKNIDKVFDFLRDYTKKNGGVTILMDELDEIGKSRDSNDVTSNASIPALLRNLDGVKTNKDMLILADTNCKDMLDSALLSRFRQRLNIPLPNKENRLNMFKIKLKDIEKNYLEEIDFNLLANKSEGLSGRDITFICDDFKYKLGYAKSQNKKLDINQVILELIDKKNKN